MTRWEGKGVERVERQGEVQQEKQYEWREAAEELQAVWKGRRKVALEAESDQMESQRE